MSRTSYVIGCSRWRGDFIRIKVRKLYSAADEVSLSDSQGALLGGKFTSRGCIPVRNTGQELRRWVIAGGPP